MPGPGKKPTKLHNRQGKKKGGGIEGFEPRPDNEKPECPDWLDLDAKAAWARLSDEMHRIGILTGVDRDALAAYCEAYSRWKKAVKRVIQDGQYIESTNKNGSTYLMAHPGLNITKNALADMHRFMREFGLTPSARSGMVISPPSLDDGDDLLKSLFISHG